MSASKTALLAKFESPRKLHYYHRRNAVALKRPATPREAVRDARCPGIQMKLRTRGTIFSPVSRRRRGSPRRGRVISPLPSRTLANAHTPACDPDGCPALAGFHWGRLHRVTLWASRIRAAHRMPRIHSRSHWPSELRHSRATTRGAQNTSALCHDAYLLRLRE